MKNKNAKIQKALSSLINKPVLVLGKKEWVNAVIIRTRDYKSKHPSACVITESPADLVQF